MPDNQHTQKTTLLPVTVVTGCLGCRHYSRMESMDAGYCHRARKWEPFDVYADDVSDTPPGWCPLRDATLEVVL